MQPLMRFVIGESTVNLEAFKCSTINQLIPDWHEMWLPKEPKSSETHFTSLEFSQLQSIHFAIAIGIVNALTKKKNQLETYESLWNSSEINIFIAHSQASSIFVRVPDDTLTSPIESGEVVSDFRYCFML